MVEPLEIARTTSKKCGSIWGQREIRTIPLREETNQAKCNRHAEETPDDERATPLRVQPSIGGECTEHEEGAEESSSPISELSSPRPMEPTIVGP